MPPPAHTHPYPICSCCQALHRCSITASSQGMAWHLGRNAGAKAWREMPAQPVSHSGYPYPETSISQDASGKSETKSQYFRRLFFKSNNVMFSRWFKTHLYIEGSRKSHSKDSCSLSFNLTFGFSFWGAILLDYYYY